VRRVLVIGSGGSGKRTFARALATRTGLPLVHLDQRAEVARFLAT
jgi:adenylate kinase family enzyme